MKFKRNVTKSVCGITLDDVVNTGIILLDIQGIHAHRERFDLINIKHVANTVSNRVCAMTIGTSDVSWIDDFIKPVVIETYSLFQDGYKSRIIGSMRRMNHVVPNGPMQQLTLLVSDNPAMRFAAESIVVDVPRSFGIWCCSWQLFNKMIDYKLREYRSGLHYTKKDNKYVNEEIMS